MQKQLSFGWKEKGSISLPFCPFTRRDNFFHLLNFFTEGKQQMKKLTKILSIFTAILTLTVALCLSGCKSTIKQQKDTAVVFEASNSVMKITTDTTLKQYLDALSKKEEFSYEADNTGFVTSVNGKAGGLNEYWLIYTSDTNNSNTDWGTFTCDDGTVLASATLGIESLVVVEGELYAFVLSSF